MAELSSEHTQLLTVPGAARHLGIGPKQLYRAIRAQELAVVRIGRWPRVRLPDLQAWIDRKRVAPTDHARRIVSALLEREAQEATRLAETSTREESP